MTIKRYDVFLWEPLLNFAEVGFFFIYTLKNLKKRFGKIFLSNPHEVTILNQKRKGIVHAKKTENK